MKTYIDSFHKESERRAAYPEHSTANFEIVANITVNSASVIPQEKKMAVRKIIRRILTKKMRQIKIFGET